MRWTSLFGLVGLGALVPSAGRGDPTESPGEGRFEFGAPIVFHNMTIVPVSTSRTGPFEQFTLLEDGLSKKSLRVRELAGQSDQAQVNAVEVKNSGPLAAFVLSGEMILGGKQDRIMANDTVVPNDDKWHRVEVFCVEQGRWKGRKMRFDEGSALAHGNLRKAALSGNQSSVWAEVQRKNAEHGTSNSTQTYRRTVQNEELRERIAKYRGELARQLPDAPLTGLVFAINGKTRVADLFGNPLLFADLQEKLLSAYVLEAIEHQVDPNAPKFDAAKAEGFYKRGSGAKETSSKVSGRSKSYKKKGKGVVGTTTVDQKSGRTLKESYIAD